MNIVNITLFFIIVSLISSFVYYYKTMRLPARVRRAQEMIKNGNDKEASEIIKTVLNKKKDYVPARYLRAQMLHQQGQFVLAISEFNAILQTPDFSRHVNELKIHYELAELYNSTKAWKKEIDEYKIILTFNPDDINANHRLGLSYYKQNRYKDAKDALMRAINSDPSLDDCYLPLGISCYQIADYNNAENFLLKAIERPYKQEEAHYYLGLILKGKKDYDNAIISFERSKTDSKLFRKSLMRIGEIYFETANYDQAITTLETGLSSLKPRDEESIEFRYLLAESYEMDNKVQEAVHHWEKIQSEQPNYRSTQIKLDEYKALLEDVYMKQIFTSSFDALQPLLGEIIARLNYNIISKTFLNKNQAYYKVYHTKRINEPPILIFFARSTHEISENDINFFSRLLRDEKCKSGIYITTSRYGLKAKSAATAKSIELYAKDFLSKSIEKIKGKAKVKGSET
ncbi:MAG: tetratricopeptide repeat protein [Spirochaetes bacterium]|nr:tetratricopeptide repeat protein [Spirochaetota bacterium]MBN2769276.1 tetratricopeptide repeat protein [Spirochaetota bacterium]HRX14885.1 tetratricopeptide repeat protein [Spirochaetota bacterium]